MENDLVYIFRCDSYDYNEKKSIIYCLGLSYRFITVRFERAGRPESACASAAIFLR